MDFASPKKKADPLSGSKVVTKDAAKATKAEPSSAKKSAKASSLFDEDDEKWVLKLKVYTFICYKYVIYTGV